MSLTTSVNIFDLLSFWLTWKGSNPRDNDYRLYNFKDGQYVSAVDFKELFGQKDKWDCRLHNYRIHRRTDYRLSVPKKLWRHGTVLMQGPMRFFLVRPTPEPDIRDDDALTLHFTSFHHPEGVLPLNCSKEQVMDALSSRFPPDTAIDDVWLLQDILTAEYKRFGHQKEGGKREATQQRLFGVAADGAPEAA